MTGEGSEATRLGTIFTIGYERSAIDDFLQTLRAAGVRVLLDVRERPHSRRRDFSRNPLREATAGVGIAYHNEPDLGAPPELRKLAKEDRDYEAFFREYRRHLAEQEPVVQRVARDYEGPIALMCYERNPEECHRSVLAERLAAISGAGIHHLQVEPGPPQQRPLDLD